MRVTQGADTILTRYDAILPDIDATLVDSNGAHAAAWYDAFAAHGRHLPLDRIRPLIGKRRRQAASGAGIARPQQRGG